MGSNIDLWQGDDNSRCNESMETRQVGSSSLNLSVLTLGTWQFGAKGKDDYWEVEYTQKMANDMVKAANSFGINSFDTASAYSAGDSEKQLGKAME